jgi:hypothetical protein
LTIPDKYIGPKVVLLRQVGTLHSYIHGIYKKIKLLINKNTHTQKLTIYILKSELFYDEFIVGCPLKTGRYTTIPDKYIGHKVVLLRQVGTLYYS